MSGRGKRKGNARGGHSNKGNLKGTKDKVSDHKKATDQIDVRENLTETCGTCEVLILDDYDMSILCDGPCSKWHHIACEKLTEKEAEFLSAGNMNISWFCNKCIGPVTDFIMDEREFDYADIENKHKELAQKIAELQTTIDGLKTSIRNLEREPSPEELEKQFGITEIKERLTKLERENKDKCTPEEVNGMIMHSIKEGEKK